MGDTNSCRWIRCLAVGMYSSYYDVLDDHMGRAGRKKDEPYRKGIGGIRI